MAKGDKITDPNIRMQFDQAKMAQMNGQSNPMVDTFLGQMPRNSPRAEELAQRAITDIPKSGGIATSIMAPELKLGSMLPALARHAPEAGSLLSSIINPLATIGKTVGGEYVGSQMQGNSPEQAAEAARHAGKMQSIVSGLGSIPRGIGHAAELINPQRFAGKQAEQIRQLHSQGVTAQQAQYKPVFDKLGDKLMTFNPRRYFGLDKKTIQYFTPNVEKSYNTFKMEPTVENAHNLQSQLYRDALKLKKPDGSIDQIDKYQALTNAREAINNRIEGYIGSSDRLHTLYDDPQDLLQKYLSGRQISREHVFPYKENAVLNEIISHEKPLHKFDPNQLLKALKESSVVTKSKKGNTPISHPLVDLEKQMANKMYQAQLAKYTLPTAGGMMAGHLMHPGLGTMAGAPGGALLGHFGGEQVAKIAQNPELIHYLQEAERIAQPAARGISKLEHEEKRKQHGTTG